MTRIFITVVFFLLIQVSLFAQNTPAIKRNQIASFMHERGSVSSLYHYIVEPNGTLSIFLPGVGSFCGSYRLIS